MQAPTPFALSQFFTALAGKSVSFALAVSPPAPNGPLIFGVYSELPEENTLVITAGLHTLALLGGSLLGLPDDLAIERVTQTPVDQPMRDAMHEVFNIGSAALSSHTRVVFRQMSQDLRQLSAEASEVVLRGTQRNSYRVSVEGAPSEGLTLYQ